MALRAHLPKTAPLDPEAPGRLQARIFKARREVLFLEERVRAIKGYRESLSKQYLRVYEDFLSTRQGPYYYELNERALAAERLARLMGETCALRVVPGVELEEQALRGLFAGPAGQE